MKNLILIGSRAAGKSKTSRRIHKYLGYQMISTDTLINYESSLSIPQFIEKKGWENFRDLEYKILQKVMKMQETVIDCGGGILFDLDKKGNELFSERKVKLLSKNSLIVFLNADLDSVIDKIENDSSRPPLSSKNSFREISKRRLPYYRKVCDLEIDTTNKKSRKICKELIPRLVDFGIEIIRDTSNLIGK